MSSSGIGAVICNRTERIAESVRILCSITWGGGSGGRNHWEIVSASLTSQAQISPLAVYGSIWYIQRGLSRQRTCYTPAKPCNSYPSPLRVEHVSTVTSSRFVVPVAAPMSDPREPITRAKSIALWSDLVSVCWGPRESTFCVRCPAS